MTQNNTCKYWPCTNHTDQTSRFCSTKCELQYEHIRADAQDARIHEEHQC